VALRFGVARSIAGNKMPEKPTIPTAEILDSVRSLLEEHPELLKIVLLIPGASSVEHLPEQFLQG